MPATISTAFGVRLSGGSISKGARGAAALGLAAAAASSGAAAGCISIVH